MKILSAIIVSLLFALPAHAAEIAHHKARLVIDPARGRIQVDDTIEITGQGPVTFLLSTKFLMKKLRVDGRVQAPKRTPGGIIVDLKDAGDHEVKIITEATLPTDATITEPPFLRSNGGLLLSGWLPHPKGRLATWDIEGSTPQDQKWVVQGTLVDETNKEGQYYARFKNDKAAEPPTLITGPFTISESRTDTNIRLRTYFHTELEPLAQGYLSDTIRYIKTEEAQIGPFPYSGFSIISGPLPVGLGLPGMTYMGRRVLALPFIRATSLPHEIIHSWWGNAVQVDFQSGNWAEGLTTFQADLVQAAFKNNDGGRSKRLEWLRNYAALPPAQDIALAKFISNSHDGAQVIGYDKAAFVFHMLKTKLGAKTFSAAVQKFYQDNKYQKAGWIDLKDAFETVSGQNLGSFFKSWVHRQGAPKLALSQANRHGFTLSQIQSGPAFLLDIPFEIETKSGIHNATARLTKKQQSFVLADFSIPTKDTVLALRIDPNFDVFRRLNGDEIPPIFRDVTLNENTRLVVLGKNKRLKTIAVNLAERLLERPVYADTAQDKNKPRLVIGLMADVLSHLKAPLPAPLLATADALAFVERKGSQTSLIVMAKTETSLENLARVLPHYKRRSYVAFSDGKVVAKGAWDMNEKSLSWIAPSPQS